MDVLGRYFGFHASALKLRAQRSDVLASNIANSATPHFKARDMDVSSTLQATEGKGPLLVSHPDHIRSEHSVLSSDVLYRVPNAVAKDGNTVELSTEQVEFAENAVKYQTTLTFLNGRISRLKSALKGES